MRTGTVMTLYVTREQERKLRAAALLNGISASRLARILIDGGTTIEDALGGRLPVEKGDAA